MRIDSIYIESFGKFKNYSLDFHDGMNIIYGDNESGKSTIMAFIEMMFYGRTAQEKSTDIGKSLRKKYTPWDGSAMCGELEFTYGGRKYRIRKVFKKTIKTDVVKLYDAQTGEEIELGRDEEIGHRFFGIDVSSFEKSVYISGFGGFSGTGQTNEDLAVRLSNLVTTMDEEISQSTVLQRLGKAKELLLSKSGSRGRLAQLTQEIGSVKAELLKNEELVRQQAQYLERRSYLEAELDECRKKKENYMLQESYNELTKEKERYEAEKSRLKEKREQLSSLLEEGRRLDEERASFTGRNYTYDTVAGYINHADELRHVMSAKQSQADELAMRKKDGPAVDREDVMLARNQEAAPEKLLYLSERISENYRPALDRRKAAIKAETEGLRMLEGIEDVPKTKLIVSAAAMLIAAAFVVMTFAISIFCLAGAFVFAGAAVVVFSAYKKQCDEHTKRIEDATKFAKKLAQDKADAINNLEREKGRLFDKGAGIYPDADCDFEAITHEKLRQCHDKLESIYGRYKASSLAQLEKLAAENEEASVNKSLYESAVDELVNAQKEYKAYVGDDDPESVRRRYNNLKEIIAVYTGRLKLQAGNLQSYMQLEDSIEAIDEAGQKNNADCERVCHRLDDIVQMLRSVNIEEADISGENALKNNIADNEAAMEDIRSQLVELASMLRSPEHDEAQLNRQLAQLDEEYEQKKELFDALKLAEENMKAAVDDVSSSFGPVLNEKTAGIFMRITGGKYENVMVDKEYSIQAKPKDGGYHEWKYLSNGTTDQAYLALRLAMTQLITENGERLPLLLDDILLQYDEKRAENALMYLKEYALDAQILFFTCRNMENEKATMLL